MPGFNWRVPSGQVQMHGQVIGGEVAADVGMGGGDWRNQLPSGFRHKIVYKIMKTLRTHHPFSGQDIDQKKIALLFEEDIFSSATSPTDYIRKISLDMLDLEMRSQNHTYIPSYAANNPVLSGGEFHSVFICNILSTAATTGMEGGNWRIGLHLEARERTVNKIVETLKMHVPFSGEEGLEELKYLAVRFEEYVYIVATDQRDYLMQISLKMQAVEEKSENSLVSTSASSSRDPLNPGNAPASYWPTYMPNFQ